MAEVSCARDSWAVREPVRSPDAMEHDPQRPAYDPRAGSRLPGVLRFGQSSRPPVPRHRVDDHRVVCPLHPTYPVCSRALAARHADDPQDVCVPGRRVHRSHRAVQGKSPKEENQVGLTITHCRFLRPRPHGRGRSAPQRSSRSVVTAPSVRRVDLTSKFCSSGQVDVCDDQCVIAAGPDGLIVQVADVHHADIRRDTDTVIAAAQVLPSPPAVV